jgi:hypothetical protein
VCDDVCDDDVCDESLIDALPTWEQQHTHTGKHMSDSGRRSLDLVGGLYMCVHVC